MSPRLIIWFTKGRAGTNKNVETFTLRVWRNQAHCQSSNFMFLSFLTSVLQRPAHNTSSAITKAFYAPLMSKFKEVLAASDKTLRRFQKEMIKHPSHLTKQSRCLSSECPMQNKLVINSFRVSIKNLSFCSFVDFLERKIRDRTKL